MDLQPVLDFLTDLSKNNNKAWMDDNKERYLEAKNQVIELIFEVIQQTTIICPNLAQIDPRKTLFRINRDIRFSKNKAPYKTNFGAAIMEGGKQSGNPGFYLHIIPKHSFVGGGLYKPSPEVLQKIRQEIDYNGEELLAIMNNDEFKKMYKAPYAEDKLKTAPREYAKNHKYIELLRLKHYLFTKNLTDKEIVGQEIIDNITESFRVLHPFNQFLSKALD